MEKELYTRTQLEIIEFKTEDVITTSGNSSDPHEYEDDMI